MASIDVWRAAAATPPAKQVLNYAGCLLNSGCLGRRYFGFGSALVPLLSVVLPAKIPEAM
jgi:hypothetical protein